MVPYERKQTILNALDQGVVYISDLASSLEVSEITIRRDLKTLEKEGRLVMLHGGAAKGIDTSQETLIDQRQALYPEEKEMIGKIAASLVEDHDVIFIDAGTTNVTMLKHLEGKSVKIVTNGFKIIDEAQKYHLPVTAIGGDLKKETMAFLGGVTSDILTRYYFDKCFLGANGIDLDFGFSNADTNESHIKELVIGQSDQAFITADHSKFDNKSNYRFAELSAAFVITDKVPDRYQNKITSFTSTENK